MTGRSRKNIPPNGSTSGRPLLKLESEWQYEKQYNNMADQPVPTMASTASAPSVVPMKRTPEEDLHVPAVSSPLNPDVTTSRSRKAPAPREQREKKESLKKRESKATSVVGDARGGTPEVASNRRKPKATSEATVLSPTRYKLPPPKPIDFEAPKAPIFLPHHKIGDIQIYETSEHVYNRKGFRYTHCIADPDFPSSLYHRQSETEPYGPRISFEDSSSLMLFDELGRITTTEKGYRMARANVGVREGNWYWECKIISGVKAKLPNGEQPEPGGHVRLGWARREASLDGPVGFDAYGYGLRDIAGQKVHMSRPKDFFPPGEDINEGDVIGLEINLPSLSLHRKVVEGHYNKAVDVADDLEATGAEAPDIIRDRVPIRYKAHLYFEQFEYHSTKELEDLMNPSPVVSSTSSMSTEQPHPNHPIVSMRTLPFSCIKVYKNGQYVGTPFTDLLAFLPPASKPLPQVGARDGLDDGMLGYFPAISVFRGGAAEVNFGPDFRFPPSSTAKDEDANMADDATSGDRGPKKKELQPVGKRYNEQIAEDIVYDLLDEVDFWMQDGGGSTETKPVSTDTAAAVPGAVDTEISEAETAALGGNHAAGEIKEIVQEDE